MCGEEPGSDIRITSQISVSSVVLDLTFDWRTRGKTESNVKSPTLGPLLAREAHEYLTGDESRAGVLDMRMHVICRMPPRHECHPDTELGRFRSRHVPRH